MFVKSTSVLATCCAMLVLVLTEQPATAGIRARGTAP